MPENSKQKGFKCKACKKIFPRAEMREERISPPEGSDVPVLIQLYCIACHKAKHKGEFVGITGRTKAGRKKRSKAGVGLSEFSIKLKSGKIIVVPSTNEQGFNLQAEKFWLQTLANKGLPFKDSALKEQKFSAADVERVLRICRKLYPEKCAKFGWDKDEKGLKNCRAMLARIRSQIVDDVLLRAVMQKG